MKTISARQLLVVTLYAVTIFLSAFLLFQVQPLMGKFILPWFGGSPGVWTTCMLVFQLLLFGGYAYAHLLHRFVPTRWQATLHASLLAGATLTLPITPTSDWKPLGDESPSLLIILLLLCKVGLPYFLLSSTGPLLQAWISRAQLPVQPYRLYSLSNVGSLLALLSFPFVFEPNLTSSEQAWFWSLAFAVFSIVCGTVGLITLRHSHPDRGSIDAKESATVTVATPETLHPTTNRFSWSHLATWFSLSMLASVMLLATTNQACLDTAVIPFLWVVPLAIYLLTFILTFESDRWYLRRPMIMLASLFFLAVYLVKMSDQNVSLSVELFLYFGSLFFACMVCHGELVRGKPAPQHLTLFYMTISAGGASGGLFVALIAPVIFSGYLELQLALFGCVLLFLQIYLERNSRWQRVPAGMKFSTIAILSLVFLGWLSLQGEQGDERLAAKRNFYGVLSVREKNSGDGQGVVRSLVHGRVVHGSQFRSPEGLHTATTYYSPSSGVGKLLQNYRIGSKRNIGVVGLGTGTLAVYATAEDRLRFYEINPCVMELAEKYFSFLKDTPAQVETTLGDARLTLEREKPQDYDILVLDAFSGDAVPIHLLTEEAMDIYCRHLRPGGVLAVHTSNVYFNLQSVVAGLAQHAGFQHRVIVNRDEDSPGALTSCWVLLSSNSEELDNLTGASLTTPAGRPIHWTDDRSNLFEVLK